MLYEIAADGLNNYINIVHITQARTSIADGYDKIY